MRIVKLAMKQEQAFAWIANKLAAVQSSVAA